MSAFRPQANKPYAHDNEGDDSPRMTVETVDNHIYFYADVDSDRCLALVRAVREVDAQLRAEYLTRGMEGMPATPIWLHIHSYGGDLFAGFSVADQLSMIKSPIHTVIEGVTASAATLISLSGDKRFILPNSFMLIHQLSSAIWGTHEQFKDEMDFQKKAMDRLTDFYVKRCNLTDKKVRKLLTRDSWLDAEACLENGFVDQIMG